MLVKKIKNNNGFTLAELMVSIFIITILLAVSTVSFYGYKKSGDSNMAALKLASDIRKVQGYALGLKEYNGLVPAGGWGIYFNKSGSYKNKYIIFANYSDGSGGPANKLYENDELFSEIFLPDGYEIFNIKKDGIPVGSSISLTFEPPDPTINMCKATPLECADGFMEIILRKTGAPDKTILINKVGLIDVND